jgi:hypothetical protein
MKNIRVAAIVGGVLTAAALGSAGAATAAPTTGSAADVVKALQDQGYSVQFNGTTNGPLSNCGVTGVHGLTVMMMPDGSLMMKMDPTNPGTVYVDVSCPSTNN